MGNADEEARRRKDLDDLNKKIIASMEAAKAAADRLAAEAVAKAAEKQK